jgi:hypothetical protein
MVAEMKPMTTWRWTLWALAMIALAMVLLLSGRPASAQMACGPLDGLLDKLRDRFKEFVTFTGQGTPEGQVFITLSDDGEFTIIQAKEGLGCIIATGKNGAFDRGI